MRKCSTKPRMPVSRSLSSLNSSPSSTTTSMNLYIRGEHLSPVPQRGRVLVAGPHDARQTACRNPAQGAYSGFPRPGASGALAPQLHDKGVRLMRYADLLGKAAQVLDGYFRNEIYPILTPQAIDPGHPFPTISNTSLNFIIQLRSRDGVTRFARLNFPTTSPASSPGTRRPKPMPRSASTPTSVTATSSCWKI